jgi:sugar phosphate isomerase/epimerase
MIGASAILSGKQLFAKSLHLPLGLQLYSVRDLLPKDYAGTLKDLGTLGFKEVESAGYYGHSAPEVNQAISDAGLKLVSAHHAMADLNKNLDSIIEFSHTLGVSRLVCSSPAIKDPERAKKAKDWAHSFTLEDWHWNADQLNLFSEKISAAGMKLGYHNHFMEFHAADGVVPYEELLRLTDPAKVTMEMDCGWVVVGGGNPVEYLRKYPKRITMLHVKDFVRPAAAAPGVEPSASDFKIAELGHGSIDYTPVFAEAAKGGNLTHVFVEQEAFTVPPKESLKIDADYMHRFGF